MGGFPEKILLSPPPKLFRFTAGVARIISGQSGAARALKPDEIPFSLPSCSHVFIREDASKPLLSPLYRGPYLVLSKYFLVQIDSMCDSVSVDGLKPVLSDHSVTPQQPS